MHLWDSVFIFSCSLTVRSPRLPCGWVFVTPALTHRNHFHSSGGTERESCLYLHHPTSMLEPTYAEGHTKRKKSLGCEIAFEMDLQQDGQRVGLLTISPTFTRPQEKNKNKRKGVVNRAGEGRSPERGPQCAAKRFFFESQPLLSNPNKIRMTKKKKKKLSARPLDAGEQEDMYHDNNNRKGEKPNNQQLCVVVVVFF
eukprot:gene1929-1168_t